MREVGTLVSFVYTPFSQEIGSRTDGADDLPAEGSGLPLPPNIDGPAEASGVRGSAEAQEAPHDASQES